MKNKVAIIGAGWVGCHLAKKLADEGHDVTLLEKNNQIFGGLSGTFGIRAHSGQHYQRSSQTRESCRRGLEQMKKEYPDLVVTNRHAIYGLGDTDADGLPPKVDAETFDAVCQEAPSARKVDLSRWGYKHMEHAYDIDEPTMLLGPGLRSRFEQYLKDVGVQIHCGHTVESIEDKGDHVLVNGKGPYDFVINATGYLAFTPPKEELPFDLDIVYQACFALVYKDMHSDVRVGEHPFSLIAMDGAYPCLMPVLPERPEIRAENYQKNEKAWRQEYYLTHGCFTIAGSYPTAETARDALNTIMTVDRDFVNDYMHPRAESHMEHFFPGFKARFKKHACFEDFVHGGVVAKPVSDKEYRSAVTFAKGRVIYVVPGKVTNIFDAEAETKAIMKGEQVVKKGNYSYADFGELVCSMHEISEKPKTTRNTAKIQTYDRWCQKRNSENAEGEMKVMHRLNNLVLFSHNPASSGSKRPPMFPYFTTSISTTSAGSSSSTPPKKANL